MPSKIGLIIEDESDSVVIAEIIKKIKPAVRPAIHAIHAGGCARIRSKSQAWAQNLAAKGCNVLIVVHDCDRHIEANLRSQLEASIKGCTINSKIIVIPIEEIEGWLLADTNAIKTAMNLKKLPKRHPNPQNIKSPKEFLQDLVFSFSNKEKRYVNTRHNERIAKYLNLAELRRCSSFALFETFIKQKLA